MILLQINFTWEPNRNPRHSWKDNATFAKVIIMFIIEYLKKTNMSFKQGALENVFSHLLLNESMLEYL
jgi:hypothetical protein